MLTTYRTRLCFYTILLTTFLVVTLAYTYIYSRNAILEQAKYNLSNTARLLTSNIKMGENGLLHHAEIIRDDPRIQEYMYMVTKIGAEENALRRLFKRDFNWLPVDRFVFLDLKGQPRLNTKNADLANAVQEHMRQSPNKIFYTQSSRGFELIAWASISYQGTPLGTIAITKLLDNNWLNQHQNYSNGYLFIEKYNVVQLSSLPESEGKTFLPRGGSIVMNDKVYQVRAISLAGKNINTLHLWYGISEQEVLKPLKQQSQIILALAILGSLGTLTMGLMIARNFNRPLNQLMEITRAVAQGALPMMERAIETNEIDTLSNRFSEMLQSLREKQEEIDRSHKRLKALAITDSLTGLHNRRYLKQIFPPLFAQTQRETYCLSGLMLDLDYFKRINDRYGHFVGDQCLAHMSEVLNESCRASDYIFRMGGEEFLILSLNDTPVGGRVLAEKIRSTLEKNPVTYKQMPINMTISIGVGFTENQLDAEAALTTLLCHTDKALYSAKENGRNQVVIYNDTLQNISPLQNITS